jgi:hypothetical protein
MAGRGLFGARSRPLLVGGLALALALGGCATRSDTAAVDDTAAAVHRTTTTERVVAETTTASTTTPPTTAPPITAAPTTVPPPPPPTTAAPRRVAPPPRPAPAPTAAPAPRNDCNPNYTPCVPNASDVDCVGGSGDGPAYVGQVTVIGTDVYGLDRDHDGIGCE